MPSKKSKGKDKKKKKEKQRMKKFDLDLFGLMTFTRFHGEPFEDFMYTPDKKQKGKKPPKAKGKNKGKPKKKKPVEIPKLAKFDPVPEDPNKIRKLKKLKKLPNELDYIITTMDLGYPEKTTRPRLPLQEGGSIRDVICKKSFPLLPRPQPHGGVYGNIKCVVCASTGGLCKTIFGMMHKKMQKLLNDQFEKAKGILEWAIEKYKEMSQNYIDHLKNLVAQMGPVLDELDEKEFDDHKKVLEWRDKFRALQKELIALRKELKRYRKHRDEVIAELLRDKIAEMEEARRYMEEMEAKVREAEEMLLDWRTHGADKLKGPKEEIDRLLALLQALKDSVLLERDTLRLLLEWEMKDATEKMIEKMEQIITADLDEVQGWMHSAWFKLFLENRQMQEERFRLYNENHLLELEVEALARQVGKLEANKKQIEMTLTYFITPPSLQTQVDKYTRSGQLPKNLELWDYPPSNYVHE